jgi:phosphoribosylamine--glycine ligase
MRILIIGGGGREHALGWCFAKAGHAVLAAPGNPGLAALGKCFSVTGNAEMVELARREKCDLVVVGPEAPLVDGLADAMREAGIDVFGPGREGARLEASKSFSKEFFARHGIRSAAFRHCHSVFDAEAAIDELGDRVVVKADGLAAGKGVVVCSSKDEARAAAREMLEDRRFGEAGASVVIEERLRGRELSVMAITDGKRYELLVQAEDHKAVGDGDVGPNTGGMGTVSPARWVDDELIGRVRQEIFDPTLRGLQTDGIDFRGVLYAGLMIEDGVPWILEYNVRFGDPETQSVVRRAEGDLAATLRGAARGELPEQPLEWSQKAAACVVLAAHGYPASPRKGDVISGIDRAEAMADVVVFHAGTRLEQGVLRTAGGRVLGVTALGSEMEDARQRAYAAVDCIEFAGMHYRTDIGARGEKQ